MMAEFPEITPKADSLVVTGRLIHWLLRRYPIQMALIWVGSLVATLSENFGIILLIPILAVAAPQSPLGSAESNAIVDRFRSALELFSIPLEIAPLLILFCVAILLKSVFLTGVTYLKQRFMNAMSANIRLRLVQALFGASWNCILSSTSGRMVTLLGNEMSRLRAAISLSIQLGVSIAAAFAYIAVALSLSWLVVFTVLAAGVISYFITGPLRAMALREGFRQSRRLREISDRIVETLQGVKALKAMHLHGTPLAAIKKQNRKLLSAQLRGEMSGVFLAQLQEPLAAIITAVVAVVALTVFYVDIAIVAVIVVIMIRLVSRVWMLHAFVQKIGNAAGAANAIFSQINQTEANEEDLRGTGRKVHFNKEIKFEAVTMAFGDLVVVSDADLQIAAPGLTVFQGPSGSGKSTLIDALLGFQVPRGGRIFVDSVLLSAMDLVCWRQQIGYLPQEVFLFADTLRYNVALGDSQLTDDRIIAALEAAEVWHYFATVRDGLDFRIAPSGSNLSGGQRQRIALARALVREPKLLILDEATSALDDVSRLKINETLMKLSRRIAVLVATHDSDLAALANKVLIIGNRKVISTSPRAPAAAIA